MLRQTKGTKRGGYRWRGKKRTRKAKVYKAAWRRKPGAQKPKRSKLRTKRRKEGRPRRSSNFYVKH